jgi:tRNA(fMet)-specific endonuclease VapC
METGSKRSACRAMIKTFLKWFASGNNIAANLVIAITVLILDTDHLSEFERGSPSGERLRDRLLSSGEAVATTIISAEEQLRGWLAQIHRLHDDVHAQVPIYSRLQRRLQFFSQWTVLPWALSCADLFIKLRRDGVRLGSMDLKIACIVLNANGLLLTRNSADFAKIPGLRFDNWLA